MTLDAVQPQIAELGAAITLWFPQEPVPATNEIIEHQCAECSQLRDDFAGLRWSDVPRETIDTHFNDLPLFSPVAHRYYIPAYLQRALDPSGDNWHTALDFVIYALCPELPEWWSERFDLFSVEQLRVAGRWLKLVLDHQALFDGDDVVGRRGYDQFWTHHVA